MAQAQQQIPERDLEKILERLQNTRLSWAWEHYMGTPICLKCKKLLTAPEHLETQKVCALSPTSTCSFYDPIK